MKQVILNDELSSEEWYSGSSVFLLEQNDNAVVNENKIEEANTFHSYLKKPPW